MNMALSEDAVSQDDFLSTFDYKLNQFVAFDFDLVVIDVASGSDTRVMVK
jgi:hypothetical protein